MGASGSKDLTVGKTMPEATAVLARRLEKCRAAAADASLKPKLALRAREKALGLLRLVSAWDGSPGSRGSLPLPPLLDAACRAVWVLEECAEEAELVLNTVLPRIQSLAERAHGAKSLQNAAVLALLTQRAYAADDFAQIVRWGQPASALLLELRGERYSVPEAQRKGFMDSWESAPSLHLCEEGHCDMLYYLVYAHANLAGQASLAHAAADRYLALVDTIWGHGHPNTVYALYAKMHASSAVGGAPWHVCTPCEFDACHRCFGAAAAAGRPVHEHALTPQNPALAEDGRVCDLCKASNDQGDIHLAIYWANRAVAVLTASSGGQPSAELATAYEMVAWLLLNPGPNFNLDAAGKMAAYALGLRRACGADESPNETLQESVDEWKESRDTGTIDAHGLAVAVAAGAALAVEAGDEDGEGVLGAVSGAYDAVSDAFGEVDAEGASLTEKVLTMENLEKVVDFFAQFF